ncbi:MAG: hypothetical protein LCI00_01405 [Chloroflexi bacterium]|nr:hypothetical protein [Chloroflexota bacterium]MCC6895652.1 hypothetical protein [Anaerolineae bacterium]
MSNLLPNNEADSRPQRLITGGLVGGFFGLIAAYFYSRAVEDDVRQNGLQRNPISTGEIIGVGLALLALLRQVSEMGRSQPKKK